MNHILALDQGTTSSRAIVFDRAGAVVAFAQKEFEQIFPQPGWVEHNPDEIWASQVSVAAEAMSRAGISAREIAAIGITNQRETAIVWERATGRPIFNAIVWQDRRTAPLCDELRAKGHEEFVRGKTGLVIDAYFSATKVKWILDHVDGARERARRGELYFGTVDSWLIWRLSNGEHATDITNASRTMLFNIHTLDWEDELLALFDIPREMLPRVHSSSEIIARTSDSIFNSPVPIAGVAGDQQAAMFGQLCTRRGMVKNTYGTGCFMLLNTASRPAMSANKLLTTIAWQCGGRTDYALEGSVFIAGAVVQWLRDGLGIVRHYAEVEQLAASVRDSGGVYFVPAFTGLGAPHWDAYASGTMVGITRGTTAAHIARAALEAIALQVADVLDAMQRDSGLAIDELRADGGGANNNLLMQIQADLLGIPVVRPKVVETTALGAAYLAGLAVGFWKSEEELCALWQVDRRFEPMMEKSRVNEMRAEWSRAIERAKGWVR